MSSECGSTISGPSTPKPAARCVKTWPWRCTGVREVGGRDLLARPRATGTTPPCRGAQFLRPGRRTMGRADGRYVVVEVTPGGQGARVSIPPNYGAVYELVQCAELARTRGSWTSELINMLAVARCQMRSRTGQPLGEEERQLSLVLPLVSRSTAHARCLG